MSHSGYHFDLEARTANRTIIETSALVLDDAGLLLMLRRRGGQGRPDSYHLPGGPQVTGETPAVAAARATLESTGVEVDITGLIGIYSDPSDVVRRPGEGWCQEFSVCFRARPVGGFIGTLDSFQEPLWVEPERLDAMGVSRATRARVAHGLAERDRPYFT